MGSGERETAAMRPERTSSSQLDAARNETPRFAITKRLIISVESSSMEIWIISSTGSSQELRRLRVVPLLGNSRGVPIRSRQTTDFLAAKG